MEADCPRRPSRAEFGHPASDETSSRANAGSARLTGVACPVELLGELAQDRAPELARASEELWLWEQALELDGLSCFWNLSVP